MLDWSCCKCWDEVVAHVEVSRSKCWNEVVENTRVKLQQVLE